MKKYFFLIISIILVNSCATPFPVPAPDYPFAVKVATTEDLKKDDDLKKRVESSIYSVFNEDNYDLAIEVFNNKIFLIGVVYKENLKDEIYRFVSTNFKKATSTTNFLQYLPERDTNLGFNNFDLKNKVGSAIFSSNTLDSAAVDYKVYNKKVYLYGYASKRQVETFLAIVSMIQGVEEVVVIVEYAEATTTLKEYNEVVKEPVSNDNSKKEESATPVKSSPEASSSPKYESNEITPPKIQESTSGDPAKENLPDDNELIFK